MACRQTERVGRRCSGTHTGTVCEKTLPALFGFLPPWISLWRCEVFSPSLLDADGFWTRTNTTAGVTQDSLLGKKEKKKIEPSISPAANA